MKRALSIILALIMLCLGASAEGLLPMIDEVFVEVYSEDMPSMRRILLRDPDTTQIVESVGKIVTFNRVTEEEFDRFSFYLLEYGCELAEYSLKNTTMNATVQKSGHTFTIFYDYSNGKTMLSYPNDTHEQEVDISALLAAAALEQKFKVGKYVKFGHYPQGKGGTDNSTIEWLVLARDGEKALLVSRYALDYQRYNSNRVDITWQECTLRTWLNETFLNKAFLNSQQKVILTMNVDNSKGQGNSEYATNGGNNTMDKVFLLSYAEAVRYFENDDARICVPTSYVIAQGVRTERNEKNGWKETCTWWLRSPGFNQYNALVVDAVGYCSDNNIAYSTVRPAMWVDLGSGIF